MSVTQLAAEDLRKARMKAEEKLRDLLAAAKSTKNTAVWRAMCELGQALEPAISPLLSRQEARELAECSKGLKEAFEGFTYEYSAGMRDLEILMKTFIGKYTLYLDLMIKNTAKEAETLDVLNQVLKNYG